MHRTRKFYIFLICISVLAFIVRYWASAEIYNSSSLSSNPLMGTDMQTYKILSQAVFKGNFNKSFYYQPFYYSVFLPGIYLIAGQKIWTVIVFQAIIGALTVFFSGMSAAYIRNRRTGIVVALLICFSLMLTFYTAFLLIATLNAFLISLLLFATVLAIKKDKYYYWLFAGFICSCLVLTRANAVLFLPLLLIISYLSKKDKIKSPPNAPLNVLCKKLVPSLLIMVVFLLPQIPFIVHNSIIEGKLTPPSTAGTANLAIGNNPEACPAGLSYTETSKYWTQHTKEVSIPKRIIIWFRTSPLSVIELTFRKLLIFWDAGTVFDNIKTFPDIRKNSKCLSYIPFIPTSLFLIGFLAVTIVLGKRIFSHKMLLFPFGLIMLYWLATAGFIHLSRYRIAILPLFAIFTAILIDQFISNSKRKGKSLKSLLCIMIASILVFGAYPLYRHVLEKRVFALIQPNGNQIILGTEKHFVDNGPISMGSWTPLPLVKNNSLAKEFTVSQKDIGKNCELHLQLICLENKPMQININGEPFTSIPTEKNMVFKFRLKVPHNGKFIIEPRIITTGNVYCYIDLQRNYGRTGFNGKKLHGELVSRLIILR